MIADMTTAFPDTIHSSALFVLVSTKNYALPISYNFQRQNRFWTKLNINSICKISEAMNIYP